MRRPQLAITSSIDDNNGVATTAHDAQQCVFGCSEPFCIRQNYKKEKESKPIGLATRACVPHPAPRMSETNQIDIHHHNYQTFGNHDRNAKRGHQYCVLGRPNRKESTAGVNGTQIPVRNLLWRAAMKLRNEYTLPRTLRCVWPLKVGDEPALPRTPRCVVWPLNGGDEPTTLPRTL